jgi:hypothetical protein
VGAPIDLKKSIVDLEQVMPTKARQLRNAAWLLAALSVNFNVRSTIQTSADFVHQVTIEMHQQANDRSCGNEAIGGAHYGKR